MISVHPVKKQNIYPYPFPCCNWKEICRVHKKIEKYNRGILHYGKRFSRTWELAIPRPNKTREKYEPPPPRPFKKDIEIVRPHSVSTRLEQLAFAKMRILLANKKKFFKRFPRWRKDVMNHQIRNKIFSLYFRLANTVPPKPKKIIKKWLKEDWKKHGKKLRKLATPKKAIKPPKIDRGEQFTNWNGLDRIAKPKYRYVEEPNEWVFKPLKKYEISPRLEIIARPKLRVDVHYKDPTKIKRGALKYKASQKIEQLAISNKKRADAAQDEFKEDPWAISPNALKYRATARIKELAEPKEYPKEPVYDGRVKPSALKYKATKRIIELAQPKQQYEPKVE